MPSFQRASKRASGDLFPTRTARAKQLTLGRGFALRPRHCLACAQLLAASGYCEGCGAFPCSCCGEHTSPNGGDGDICHRCSEGLTKAAE